MIQYAQGSMCRRKQLLEYFHETFPDDNCASCDNCLNPKETFDGTEIAQKILSCVYRVNERFGPTHIVTILTGSKSQKLVEYGHNTLSTYGILSDTPLPTLRAYIDELIQKGYLSKTDDMYGILSLTPRSVAVLKGRAQVPLTKQAEIIVKRKETIEDSRVDRELFEALRRLRKTLANDKNVPPYVIFSDKSLKEMAIYAPKTLKEFAQINGVGTQKLDTYGELFTNLIRDVRGETA
jgi:ATP-dependent DNA helicase RecQ